MYTLYLDTHSDSVIVVLYKDGATFGYKNVPSRKDHCTLTMSTIDQLLKEKELTIKNINEIIVVNGPGSFTGVRIGVTIAKTLAYVLNISIKTISCLEVYAISNKKGFGKLIAVKDPKGYYFAMFNQKSELMWDYDYLLTDKFNAFIEEKNLERMVIKSDFDYDIDEIYSYCRLKSPMNPHEVNPLYVKSIEVEDAPIS